MFGFKRRAAERAAAKRRAEEQKLENIKREALAAQHSRAQHDGSRVPFSKREDVQRVVQARDSDTVTQAAATGNLYAPGNPLYPDSAYGGVSRDCGAGHQGSSHHGGHGTDHGTSHGGGYGSYDSGSCGGGGGDGGGGGGGD